MDFGDKLNLLMKTLKVNNSKLARALSVDPSLVSKWRNKKRVPSAVSPYPAEMVSYFSSLHLHNFQRVELLKVLEEHAALTDKESSAALQEALAEWLSPENEKEAASKYHPHTQNEPGGTSAFLNIFDGIFTQPAGKKNITAPFLFKMNKPETLSLFKSLHHFELYRGRAGKREAVLAFLDLVLTSAEPLELLLTSQENLQWILEDKKFTVQWEEKLRLALEQGHKITIIHTTNRELSDLTSIMKYWLPLHLTGNVESFYHPQYVHTIIKATYFIIKNKACIVSFLPEDAQSDNYSFFFPDSLVTKIFEASFYAFLEQCKKLLYVFTGEQMIPFMEKMVQLEGRSGDLITFKNHLSSLTIPLSLYEDILQSNNLPPQEIKKRLQLHEKRLQSFIAMTEHYNYCEIFPYNIFFTLPGEENIKLSSVEFFLEENIYLNRRQLVALLEHTIQVLENNKHYEIFFAGGREKYIITAPDLSFIYKENHAAVVTTSHGFPHKHPVAIMSNEGNIVRTFEEFFQDLQAEIPSFNRTKNQIITKLKKLYHQL